MKVSIKIVVLGDVYMIPVRLSFRYEFIPVPLSCSSVFVYMIPVQNVIPVQVHSGSRTGRTGKKSDHILYRYHVKEVRGFVPVRDEWDG